MTFCRKIVIIGGSDAAVSAALRARERSRDADITLLFADHYPNFSICGLPFYLSGEVADWKKLAHRTFDEIEREGIRLMAGLSATGIFPKDKKIEAATTKGDVRTIPYDKLIVCTGGASMVPQWPGIDLPGVFFLRWMTDGLAISAYLEKRRPSSLIIIGAGYIGMEMADAMVRRGLAVSVVEYAPSTLTTFDSRMGAVVEEELIRHGVSVFTSFSVSGISSSADQLIVHSKEGRALAADMILVAAGSRPETSLALTAGITTGFKNAICVNRKMETNLQDVYAAGDCVETYSRLLGKNIYLPLGSTAYKQGRIAGENAAGAVGSMKARWETNRSRFSIWWRRAPV